MNDFVRLEDRLKLGHTIINVKPKMGRYDKESGTFVDKDKQASGTTSNGNQFWTYTTDVPTGKTSVKGNEVFCTIAAFNPEQKALLDGGRVDINMIEVFLTPEGKWLPEQKLAELGIKPMKVIDDETGEAVVSKKKRYYINKITENIPGAETVPEYNNPNYG